MKLEKFNITFFCERGKWELEECSKFPTKENIEVTIESLEKFSLGKIKKIVIEIV